MRGGPAHRGTDGEIKRMYVSPDARGRGIGRAVLAALLETGLRQGEALALYERAGFSRIPAFGEYASSPLSVCMAKDL
jgi:GNAT superfamily N-acetyltransferase